VNATVGGNTTLSAPLGHINVHIRDSSALLIHENPQYTIEQTRESDYALLVSQAKDGYAFGTAYLDDGISYPPGPNTTVTFTVSESQVVIESKGAYNVGQRLQNITVLGMILLIRPG
jgi:alpha-glucosidase